MFAVPDGISSALCRASSVAPVPRPRERASRHTLDRVPMKNSHLSAQSGRFGPRVGQVGRDQNVTEQKPSDSLLRTLQHPLDSRSLRARLRFLEAAKHSRECKRFRNPAEARDSSTQIGGEKANEKGRTNEGNSKAAYFVGRVCLVFRGRGSTRVINRTERRSRQYENKSRKLSRRRSAA